MEKKDFELSDFTQKFNEGDFIQRNNPYKGEHEKLIVKVNVEKKQYEVAWMKGKHSPKPDFNNLEIIDFNTANDHFHKVG